MLPFGTRVWHRLNDFKLLNTQLNRVKTVFNGLKLLNLNNTLRVEAQRVKVQFKFILEPKQKPEISKNKFLKRRVRK